VIFVGKARELQFLLEVMRGFDGRYKVDIEILADSELALVRK
jgi:hypothetical protein